MSNDQSCPMCSYTGFGLADDGLTRTCDFCGYDQDVPSDARYDFVVAMFPWMPRFVDWLARKLTHEMKQP